MSACVKSHEDGDERLREEPDDDERSPEEPRIQRRPLMRLAPQVSIRQVNLLNPAGVTDRGIIDAGIEAAIAGER